MSKVKIDIHIKKSPEMRKKDLYTNLYTLSTEKEGKITKNFEQMFCWIIIKLRICKKNMKNVLTAFVALCLDC